MGKLSKLLSACGSLFLLFLLLSSVLQAEPVATTPEAVSSEATETAETNTAIIPVDRNDISSWRKRYQSMNKKAEEDKYDLVFLGDSITHSWERDGKEIWKQYYEPRKALNLGIGGDRTEHIIWRLQNGNLGNIQPKVLVLMIGTNNTGHKLQDPTEVAVGIEKILDILGEKLPETKIVLLAIFPRGENAEDKQRLNNDAINKLISSFHDGEKIHYLDIGNVFLEPDGTLSKEIMPDLLHLSPKGYQLWASALEAKLKELGL